MNNINLYNSLIDFAKKTIVKTLEYKKSGRLETTPCQFIPVLNIDYELETYFLDWDKIQYFDNYTWLTDDFLNFIDKEIHTLPEFELAASEMIKVFDVPEFAIKKIGLKNLIHLIVNGAPNGKITYGNIDHYVNLLINDYSNHFSHTPTTWNIDLYFSNIHIASEEIEIAPKVFLRRPNKEQLADIKQRPYNQDEFATNMGRMLPCGAILSFSSSERERKPSEYYPKRIVSQIENWLNIFRLFKPSNLIVTRQYLTPVSIMENPIFESIDIPNDTASKGKVDYKDTSSYKFYLKKEEEDLFISFVKQISDSLKGISHTTYLKGSAYELAFHRYNDSLLKSEVNAYKILSSISSIEALLSDGSTEITFKIRLRVAKLLSFFGFNAIEVSTKMRDAYNLRSKLVHGATPEDKSKDLLEFARKHTHEILNYNRICLLISLQLKKHLDKSNLLKLIDDSLIDEAANKELNSLVIDKVRIPIVNPFRR